MTTTQNQPKSNGLGATVIEYPAGTKRQQSAAPEPKAAAVHKLDLLKHIPDGHFKTYVSDVAKMCSINPSTTMLVGLGIVSSVACRAFAILYPNGDLLPSGEYVMGGGVPGDGKSRALKAFQYPIFQAHKQAVKDWDRKAKEQGDKFEEPYPARIFVTDTTVEALESILNTSSGYFSLASAEQAVINTLTGASYGGEGRKNNNDLPLKGFNGEYHSSSRSVRSGAACYTGIVVGSITCFAQPAAIETILRRSKGSGMAERFLMIEEPTQQGTRDHTRQHYPQEYSQNVYNRIVGELVARAIAHPQDFEDLPAYRISSSDWRTIYLFRNEIEPHLADGGKYSTATMRGVASKVDMHVMKLASLLAYLYEHPIGEIPSQFIDAAIGIMKDMLDYTLNLLSSIGVVGTDAEENCIIAYLGDKKTATRRQVQQARHRHKPFSEAVKPSAAIGQAIDRLIQKGIVSESEEYDTAGNSKGKLLRLVA